MFIFGLELGRGGCALLDHLSNTSQGLDMPSTILSQAASLQTERVSQLTRKTQKQHTRRTFNVNLTESVSKPVCSLVQEP